MSCGVLTWRSVVGRKWSGCELACILLARGLGQTLTCFSGRRRGRGMKGEGGGGGAGISNVVTLGLWGELWDRREGVRVLQLLIFFTGEYFVEGILRKLETRLL